MLSRCQRCDHDRPGVDANPYAKLVSPGNVAARVKLVDGANQVEAAAHGALGVVLVGGWGPEESEDSIAHEAGDLAAVTFDGPVHALESLADEGGPVFGIEPLRDRGRPRNVGKQDRNRAALADSCSSRSIVSS